MQEALTLVMPTDDEREKIKRIIGEFSKKIKIKNTKIELGGSVAKDTWLKGEHDIDIYVKFDPKAYGKKNISEILKKTLEKNYKIEKVHGSRDYYRIYKSEYIIEVVPILNITKVTQAKNITDVSPFHVKFVKKHKKIVNEIRLAKAFCKSNNLYGAESYIQGFSGYVLEILIIHYGSFNKLLKEVAKWNGTIVLDPKQYYKYKNVMFSMNKSKLTSPLILVDPVQAERNAAAGVGENKYNKLIKLAKRYLKTPSKELFKRKQLDLKSLKKKAILIEATETKGKRDVAGAKLMKAFDFFIRELNTHDFEITESDWQWEQGKKAIMWFVLKEKKIAKTKKHYGPPLRLEVSVEKFKKAWKGYKLETEKDKCYVMIKRKYTDARTLLKTSINNKYLKGKAKSIKLI
ncbi:MAG: CCA tRNA nucleotidyltransferase [archaeon]